MKQTRRAFLQEASLLAAMLPLAKFNLTAAEFDPQGLDPRNVAANLPEVLQADSRLRLDFGAQHLIIDGSIKPWILGTHSGALVVNGQVISRDGGSSWTSLLKAGQKKPNIGGSVVQLRDGTILGISFWVTPGEHPGQGRAQLYSSTDDWRTLQGPEDITFDLPGVNFHGSTDDGGHPHAAQLMHRRILELPNGDLLATLYGWFRGDDAPAQYLPSMKRTRVMLARSTNRGRHWRLVSTVAYDPKVGTEGFDEAVLARISHGPHTGRLLCLMRTGRELYDTISDDEGLTWRPPRPRIFANIDINRTELWADMFRSVLDRNGRPLGDDVENLRGAVVDPDLIELRSGILAAVFGVRVPQKACHQHYQHPWNGNYLALSVDHGETWSNVIRMTSGVPTTHYMGVAELPTDNRLFVAYDFGYFGRTVPIEYSYGRTVQIAPNPS